MFSGHSQAMLELLVEYVESFVESEQKNVYIAWKQAKDLEGQNRYLRNIEEFHKLIFNQYFTYDEFIAHMVFILYKHFYLDQLSRHPFSGLDKMKAMDDDAGVDKDVHRRNMNRALAKACERKYQDAERLGTTTEYIDLVAKKEKLEGERSEIYHLSDPDVSGIESYQANGLEIVHLLARGTMGDSKGGVTGKKIACAYKEYLSYVKKGAQQKDSDKWINALLDLSSLESQSCPSFLYAVAEYMSSQNITHIPKDLSLLCGVFSMGINGGVESRFLCNRIPNISRFFQSGPAHAKAAVQYYSLLSIQHGVFVNLQTDDKVRWLVSQIGCDHAKAFFSRHYNLFTVCTRDTWNSTTWSPKLVKAYRKVICELTYNGHNKAAEAESKGATPERDVPRSE